MILTIDQIAKLVVAKDFGDPIVAVAVVLGESGGRTDARNLVNNPTSAAHNSWDRGLWQINSYWHPKVTEAQADDPVYATDYARSISAGGSDFHLWSVYTSGSYQRHLVPAAAAVVRVLEDPMPTADEYAAAAWSSRLSPTITGWTHISRPAGQWLADGSVFAQSTFGEVQALKVQVAALLAVAEKLAAAIADAESPAIAAVHAELAKLKLVLDP